MPGRAVASEIRAGANWRIATGLVLVVACGPLSTPIAEQPPATPGAQTSFPADPTARAPLPLNDLFNFAWADRRAIRLAIEIGIAQCMKELGWPYNVPELPVHLSQDSDRRYGYQPSDRTTDPFVSEPGEDPGTEGGSLPKLGSPQQVEAWERALYGDGFIWVADGVAGNPAGGCTAEAETAILGDRVAYKEMFYQLQVWMDQTWRASRADPVVVDALAGWSDCMAEKGIHASDPLELVAGEGMLGNLDPRIEADLACKELVRLIPIWSEVEAGYQARLLEENEGDINEWLQQRGAALESAQAVVGP